SRNSLLRSKTCWTVANKNNDRNITATPIVISLNAFLEDCLDLSCQPIRNIEMPIMPSNELREVDINTPRNIIGRRSNVYLPILRLLTYSLMINTKQIPQINP